MANQIYEDPDLYDLEHESDDEDVAFYCELVRRLKPQRVLELGCGNGRVTVPVWRTAAAQGASVVGIDSSSAMLEDARRKASDAGATSESLQLLQADLLEWEAPEPFDLIIVPCSTLTHLLELDQQIAAWQRAHANLVPGGRFVVDLAMPNLRLYAQSMLLPPTIGLELDIDEHAAQSGDRLIRYRATRYTPHQQQATVWFLYDRFDGSQVKARMVSDFVGHVYFPREVELLYRIAGFRVVCKYGDYHFHRLSETSRSMIMIGEREPHDA